MELVRLNGDCATLFRFETETWLLDPWLKNSQIDYFRAFSEQWHREPCIYPTETNFPTQLIISHPFTDHFHLETLLDFPADIPVYLPEKRLKLVQKQQHFKNLYRLQDHPAIELVKAPGDLSGLYTTLVLHSPHGDIWWGPHGIRTAPAGNPWMICTSFTSYGLWFMPGGKINLGKETALKHIQQYKPRYILPIHDEQKKAAGFVAAAARPVYPDYLSIAENLHETKSRLLNIQIGESVFLD